MVYVKDKISGTISAVKTYKECIEARKELQLIVTDIQSFKLTMGCIHYLSPHERTDLNAAQRLLSDLADKYEEIIITEEL